MNTPERTVPAEEVADDRGHPGPRSQVRRMPQRGHYDEATVNSILDAGLLAHVGFAIAGQPYVIPTLYARDGRWLYLHGSAASRMLRVLASGVPACVSVTLVDGLVLARSAFSHSMNYRSVVAFGTLRIIAGDEDKCRALRCVSEHLLAGRWDDVRGPSTQELKATTVLEFDLEEASAKIRTGPPQDEAADYDLPHWAGVLPLHLTAGVPEPDPRLAPDAILPAYLRHHSGW